MGKERGQLGEYLTRLGTRYNGGKPRSCMQRSSEEMDTPGQVGVEARLLAEYTKPRRFQVQLIRKDEMHNQLSKSKKSRSCKF